MKAGQRYEVVFKNFHVMSYLRNRLGDLIKITTLEDREAEIKIPRMVFDSRADDLIDIASFLGLDDLAKEFAAVGYYVLSALEVAH